MLWMYSFHKNCIYKLGLAIDLVWHLFWINSKYWLLDSEVILNYLSLHLPLAVVIWFLQIRHYPMPVKKHWRMLPRGPHEIHKVLISQPQQYKTMSILVGYALSCDSRQLYMSGALSLIDSCTSNYILDQSMWINHYHTNYAIFSSLQCTVRCRYNTTIFIQIQHKRHQSGRDTGCLLWFLSLIYLLP